MINTVQISIISGGLHDGNTANIFLDNVSIFASDVPHRPLAAGRGLNVCTISEETGDFLQYARFDIYKCGEADKAFCRFISSSRKDCIVVIAVKDDAENELSEICRWACRGLGSGMVDQLGFRDSWAMIGRVGAAPLSAVEEFKKSTTGLASRTIEDYPLQLLSNENRYTVSIFCSGKNDGDAVDMHVNGVSILPSSLTGKPFPLTSGLHLAVLDEGTATLEAFRSFDLWTSREVNELLQIYVQEIRHGRVLLLAGTDMAGSEIDRKSRTVFKKIGSNFVDHVHVKHSWAMIAHKELENGTVTEEKKKNGEGPAIVSASLAYNLNTE